MSAKRSKQIGFFDAVSLAFRRYSEFEGRSTRPEFWWYALFYMLVLAICNAFTFVQLSESVTLGSLLSTIFSIGTILPTLGIGVRRLRDAGNEWGHMFWLFLPFAGIIVLAIMWAQPTKR